MISIIIPAYNCGHCIERTLNSILAQTYKKFEIIIVNDGSADNTDAVIQKYMGEHNDAKISYRVTENGGPGSARNYGLSMAQGEYVVFVDSDDVVCPLYLETLYNGITDDVDFCFGSYHRIIDGDINKSYFMTSELYGTHPAENIFVSFFSNKTYISLWNSIFLNAIIKDNNLRFIDRCYNGEDVEFIARYLMCCKNVKSLKDDIYTFYFDSVRAAKRMEKDSEIRIQDSVFWNLTKAAESIGWNEGKKVLEYGKIAIESFMKIIGCARGSDTYDIFHPKAVSLKNDYDYQKKINKKYLRASTYYKARLAMLLFDLSPKLFYYLFNRKTHR